MSARPLPAKNNLTLCFAHVAYRMGERFALRNADLDWFEVRSLDDLKARITAVDVLLCSGLWRNELIPAAPSPSLSLGTTTPNGIKNVARCGGLYGTTFV